MVDAPQAKAYHRIKRFIFLADLCIYAVFVVAFQISGLSSSLAVWARQLSQGSRFAELLLYGAVFFVALYASSLPLHFYSGVTVEHRFHLSTQSASHWWSDQIKKFVIGTLFFLLTFSFFYLILDVFPNTWWVVCAGGWLFLTLFLSRILPTVLMPIFYKIKPLERIELKERLLALCRRVGVSVLGIYEIAFSKKTRKANAAVVGLGSTRRVILGDTLIDKFSTDEIEMVMAHELGHHVKRHVMRFTIFSFVASTVGFYLLYQLSGVILEALDAESLTDISIFPAIAFLGWVGGLLLLPIQNGFSRWQERQADRFALETIPSKEIFCSLMSKLMTQNLADPSPSAWIEFLFYDHPSIPKRIQFAQNFSR